MSAIVAGGAGSIPRLSTLRLDQRVLLFSLSVALLSAFVFGLAPAFRAARTEPRDALGEQTRSSTGSRRQLRVRRGLVAAQVALAFVLLVGAGLLMASVQRLRELDLGVRPDSALVFGLNLPDARYDSTARAASIHRSKHRSSICPVYRTPGESRNCPPRGRTISGGRWRCPARSPTRGGARAQRRIAWSRATIFRPPAFHSSTGDCSTRTTTRGLRTV